MSNLRAKEAARAEEMFVRERERTLAAPVQNDVFGTGASMVPEEEVKQAEEKKPVVKLDDVNWGGDDDEIMLDDDDLGIDASAENGGTDTTEAVNSDIFVPPSEGIDPLKDILRQNPTNVAIHVACGDFRKGLELL